MCQTIHLKAAMLVKRLLRDSGESCIPPFLSEAKMWLLAMLGLVCNINFTALLNSLLAALFISTTGVYKSEHAVVRCEGNLLRGDVSGEWEAGNCGFLLGHGINDGGAHAWVHAGGPGHPLTTVSSGVAFIRREHKLAEQ